jgi:hypothetical protein
VRLDLVVNHFGECDRGGGERDHQQRIDRGGGQRLTS